MKRLLVETIPAAGQLAEVPSDELHHLLKVRRVKGETEVELLDGKGMRARAMLTPQDRRRAEVRVIEVIDDPRESPLQLTLVLAIPESLSTLDGMLPGMVQLGAQQIVLTPSEYGGSLRKDPQKYHVRLQEIARQSLKQCGRTQIPNIEIADSFRQALALCQHQQLNIMLHPGTQDTLDAATQPESISLWIGPEGGFSPVEVDQWRAAKCGPQLSLGPRILKMETAVIGATFHLQRIFGDLSH